jgi:DNA-binding NarL/FixJ family response regulator
MFESSLVQAPARNSFVPVDPTITGYAEPSAPSGMKIEEALLQGELSVAQRWRRSLECTAVIVPRWPATALRPLDACERSLLLGLARAESQKVLAVDLGCSPATVSLRTQMLLIRMGIRARPIAVWLFSACRRGKVTWNAPPTSERSRAVRVTISPSPQVDAALSPAERDVVGLVLDGLSNASIATLRDKSSRTIANQVASVAQKLGAGGRLELVARLYGVH